MSASGEEIRSEILEQLSEERNARVVLRAMVRQLKAAVELGELLLGGDVDEPEVEPTTLRIQTLGGNAFDVEIPPDRFPSADELAGDVEEPISDDPAV